MVYKTYKELKSISASVLEILVSDEELKKIEAHAYALGVKSHTSVDAVKGYYDSIIKYLIYGNVLKNNTYPLSVSAERLSQALNIAKLWQKSTL